MEPLAEPGTLIISEAVHRLVQGYFVCESMGRHAVRGVAQPMELFRVVQASTGAAGSTSPVRTGLTPLVGRDLEVGLLADRWQQAKEGIGQTVLLVGEAGIGKSRLVHVIKEQAQAEQKRAIFPRSWSGDAHPSTRTLACTPSLEFFEQLLQIHSEDTPRRRLQKLLHHLRLLGMDSPETVRLFAEMLSITIDDEKYPPRTSPPSGSRNGPSRRCWTGPGRAARGTRSCSLSRTFTGLTPPRWNGSVLCLNKGPASGCLSDDQRARTCLSPGPDCPI